MLRVAKPSQPKAARESLPRYQNEAPGVVRTSGALVFNLDQLMLAGHTTAAYQSTGESHGYRQPLIRLPSLSK